jgi:hypothetical protein
MGYLLQEEAREANKSLKKRKLSSSSMTPSIIGSMTSSAFGGGAGGFKINIIKPLEVEDSKPLRTLELKDINGTQLIHSTIHNGPKSTKISLKNLPVSRLESLIKLQKIVKGYLARRNYKFLLQNKDNPKIIYKRILFQDGNYNSIQGVLTGSKFTFYA